MKSTTDFTFSDLVNSKEFEELHKIITDFTGVPMNLADAESTDSRLEVGKDFCPPSRFNPVCRLIRTTEEGCQRCLETDTFHVRQAVHAGQGRHYICHAGLVDFAVPIMIQQRNVGVINCGQIFSEPPSESGLLALQERLSGLGLDESELREAYYQTPYMPQEKIDSLLRLLTFFAQYFYEVGMRLKEAQKDRKYPEIAKAKEYIKDQFRESISLKNVADHVYLSEAYLSRLFHRVEGVTFSQYLQSVRVAEAKKLLTRTDWSVSQIAFSVGFSSLSYFNQFFKKIEACTPSQYREEFSSEEANVL